MTTPEQEECLSVSVFVRESERNRELSEISVFFCVEICKEKVMEMF